MPNQNLTKAKIAKQDEFYTQYNDIQKEVNAYFDYDPDVFKDKTILLPCDDPELSNFTKFFAQNFEEFGLRKLISTSYTKRTFKTIFADSELSAQDTNSAKGKILVLTRENIAANSDNFKWEYLNDDGDFRSDEVKALRDEADLIITNPPFSLFREFISWIFEASKKFLVIGNMNSITYKEVFPLIKNNRMWLGVSSFNRGMYFFVPKDFTYANTYKFSREIDGKPVNRVPGICWFTNIDHGRRHKPLQLMTMSENIVKDKNYCKYDNYNAIEVPCIDAIPSDYDGVMGVPITFLNKHCPEQFEIVGATESEGRGFSNGLWNQNCKITQALVNNNKIFKRIFIQKPKSLESLRDGADQSGKPIENTLEF